MKIFKMLIWMTLVPGAVSAGTICKVTEFSDYYEAVCIGDEKAVPATEPGLEKSGTSSQSVSSSSAETKPVYASPVTSKSASTNQTLVINTAHSSGTVESPQTMIIPKNTVISAETSARNVHRHGRQQYSRALQEAIAARLQLISP